MPDFAGGKEAHEGHIAQGVLDDLQLRRGPSEVRPATARAAHIQGAGALYVSCSGRGGAHFGGPSAELQIIQHALGDVPLVGFFAAGEIGHHHLYGYTGVLTVFVREP